MTKSSFAVLIAAIVATAPSASGQSVPQVIAAGPGPTRVRLNGDNATVLLQPKAVLTRPLATAGGVITVNELMVKLTGEAVFEVTAQSLQVETPAGTVTLMIPGRYAVRCTDPCTELQVTVAKGAAVFRGPRPSVVVTSGKFGRMTQGGAELTAGAGYPEVPSPPGGTTRDTTHRG